VHASTHDLTIGVSEVTKRFTSWQRGEAAREWEALTALADRAPGLAPRPLRRTVEAGRPVVVMSRLPGIPLGDRLLTPSQVIAVADAMTELHEALSLGEFSRFPRCRLVDFEDGGLSDQAFEIADLVEHLSTWLHGVVAAEELLPLLVSDPAAADRVLQARRVLAFYWLNLLLPGKPAHRRNPPGSCERQARRLLELLARPAETPLEVRRGVVGLLLPRRRGPGGHENLDRPLSPGRSTSRLGPMRTVAWSGRSSTGSSNTSR
jgi:hypothetical protein